MLRGVPVSGGHGRAVEASADGKPQARFHSGRGSVVSFGVGKSEGARLGLWGRCLRGRDALCGAPLRGPDGFAGRGCVHPRNGASGSASRLRPRGGGRATHPPRRRARTSPYQQRLRSRGRATAQRQPPKRPSRTIPSGGGSPHVNLGAADSGCGPAS